ncbi:hypothetical protein SLA2020_197340 [Shorea laevis]
MSDSSQANQILTVQQIIGIIPSLIESLSKARVYIGPTPRESGEGNGGGTGEVEESGESRSEGMINDDHSNSGQTSEITQVGSYRGREHEMGKTTTGGDGGGQEQVINADNNSTNLKSSSGADNQKTPDENVSCWGLGYSDTHDHQNGHDGDNKDGGSKDHSSSDSIRRDKVRLHGELGRLLKDLSYIHDSFMKLKELEDSLITQIKDLQQQGNSLESICKKITQSEDLFHPKSLQSKIHNLSKMIVRLKLQIPLLRKMSEIDGHRNQAGNEINVGRLVDELRKLHKNGMFSSDPAFKDVEKRFSTLKRESKLCLLYFTVFPENVVVEKRMLKYWWVGEGFVDPEKESGLAEKFANETMEELLSNGFIEPIIRKRRLIGYRMHPLVRSVLVSLASKVAFFSFDEFGNPTADFKSSLTACLVKTEDRTSQEALVKKGDPEKLHALFNVNDPYPDFNVEWFSRLKNVNVISLGRWQSTTALHIEVENTEFLKGMKNMKYLRFFSLEGVSRITQLPDAICMVPNLRILDLSACHNLQVLPEKIFLLKKLTHFDASNCYMLDNMPKGLTSLTELQVLKGFVISDQKSKYSCKFGELVALKKLRKLSVYTSEKDFPTEKDMEAFQEITSLQKLSIEWGGNSLHDKHSNSTDQDLKGQPSRSNAFKKQASTKIEIHEKGLPENLEKLTLKCFPRTKEQSWLCPNKLKKLKKLSIIGGNLQELESGVHEKWKVVRLHLKFLRELKMYWRDLEKSFPNLIYLEKVDCPRLTFFPCDDGGVWWKRKSPSEQYFEYHSSLGLLDI